MRLFVLLLLVSSLASLANAQVRFAPKAGINVAYWSGDDAGDHDSRIGLVGGISLQAQFRPVGVVAEFLYSEKGIQRNNRTLKFDYLEVVALGRYAIPMSNTNGLDVGVSAGPWVGIPVGTDLDAVADVGLALGFDVGSGPFYIEARYDLGLTDIPDTTADLDIENRSLSVTTGFRING